jgi:hypothetical protein
MVLRVAMADAAERDLDALTGEVMRGVHRLANEAEGVKTVLGDIYPRFKRYVTELGNVVVRGQPSAGHRRRRQAAGAALRRDRERPSSGCRCRR